MIDAFPPERIARLRKILAKHNPPAVSCVMENIPAALDEIERLTAERDSLIDQVRAMSGVSATLSRVTAERDEAVGLLSGLIVGKDELALDRLCKAQARSFLSRMGGRK